MENINVKSTQKNEAFINNFELFNSSIFNLKYSINLKVSRVAQKSVIWFLSLPSQCIHRGKGLTWRTGPCWEASLPSL